MMLEDDDFLKEAQTVREALSPVIMHGYDALPIPSPPDEQVSRLVELYRVATPVQREVLRTADTRQEDARAIAGLLNAYAVRMAMLAVRRGDPAILQQGIVAVAMTMDWAWSDPRDAGYIAVPVLIHAGRRIATDPTPLFTIGQEVAIGRMTKGFLVPPQKDPEGGLLAAIGWEEHNGPAGVVFYRKGQAIPQGWLRP